MKKPKMPKNKTLKTLSKYEDRLDDYNKVVAMTERLRKKGDKSK